LLQAFQLSQQPVLKPEVLASMEEEVGAMEEAGVMEEVGATVEVGAVVVLAGGALA
jgi:hypothetical protein